MYLVVGNSAPIPPRFQAQACFWTTKVLRHAAAYPPTS